MEVSAASSLLSTCALKSSDRLHWSYSWQSSKPSLFLSCFTFADDHAAVRNTLPIAYTPVQMSIRFTVRNVTVNNAVTAINAIWGWAWTWQGVTINNCSVSLCGHLPLLHYLLTE